ncbi:MAG: NERD domain-containing protein [Candidatus Eremiobacterota bacterium]
MATMLPPRISENCKSSGEEQIFHLFSRMPGTEDWFVMHSLNLSEHTKRLYGEIDFLVFAPGFGIFILEVKSGRVKREQGIWYYTNRYGKTSTSHIGPFDQAREAMFSLKTNIKAKFGTKSNLHRLLFGFGVIFPHITFSIDGIDYEPWQVYDRGSDSFTIKDFILKLAANTRKKFERCRWFDPIISIPHKNDILAIVSYLRGDFDRPILPEIMMKDTEKLLLQYTEEQYQCLDRLIYNPRCIFQGAAGTGKTMIALESARRSIFNGEKVLLLCFNKPLGHFLKEQFHGENRPMTGPFHQYLMDIIKLSGKNIQSFSKRREDFPSVILPDMFIEVAKEEGYLERFDKIIIDEGQDLITEKYLDVFNILLKNGLAKGRWEFYCDFEKQAIYSPEKTGKDMLNLLKSRADFVIYCLTVNCRNTKPIGEEIAIISGFEKPPFLPAKFSGPSVNYYFYSYRQKEAELLKDILLKLEEEEKISPMSITLLSPFLYRNSCVHYLESSKIKIQDLGDNDISFIKRNGITFSTIHRFKGLENSFIILLDIENIINDNNKSLLYTAMSRSRYGLYMLLHENCREEYKELFKRSTIMSSKDLDFFTGIA